MSEYAQRRTHLRTSAHACARTGALVRMGLSAGAHGLQAPVRTSARGGARVRTSAHGGARVRTMLRTPAHGCAGMFTCAHGCSRVRTSGRTLVHHYNHFDYFQNPGLSTAWQKPCACQRTCQNDRRREPNRLWFRCPTDDGRTLHRVRGQCRLA